MFVFVRISSIQIVPDSSLPNPGWHIRKKLTWASEARDESGRSDAQVII
jgi:hypothetical protein